MTNEPQFLGIGAPRSGTTWLYERLSEHPDFKLPPLKELHYFDRDRGYLSPNTLCEDRVIRRFTNSSWRRAFIRTCGSIVLGRRSVSDGMWYLKFFFSKYDDQWYLSLFDHAAGICGEITPAYMLLNDTDVERIYELTPNVKTVFFLRDPLTRAWSSYRKTFLRNGKALPDLSSIRSYLDSQSVSQRANYIETLDRYQTYSQPERMLIGFFDAIEEQPLQTLQEVVSFLGGDISKVAESCFIDRVSNASPNLDMPDEIKTHLSTKYRSLITELSDRFGGYCTRWMNRYFSTEIDCGIMRPTIVL